MFLKFKLHFNKKEKRKEKLLHSAHISSVCIVVEFHLRKHFYFGAFKEGKKNEKRGNVKIKIPIELKINVTENNWQFF